MYSRRLIGMMIICAVLAGGSVALAQGGRPGGGRGGGQERGGPPPLPDAEQIEAMVDQLDEALDLSDEQEEQVSELYFDHFEEVKSAMTDRPDRSRMESLRSAFEENVKAVLDDDQQEAFAEYLKSRGPGSEHRRPRR